EVMALFFKGFAGPEYRRRTALAAIDLAAAIDPADIAVGVGANAGIAYVGNVGSGSVTDFTALGDAVNLAARLQSLAAPGEVVLLASSTTSSPRTNRARGGNGATSAATPNPSRWLWSDERCADISGRRRSSVWRASRAAW